ncbi:MAG: oxygenase MpaB family protein [Marmoricola sp.]
MAHPLDDADTSLLVRGASVFTVLSGTANVVMQLSRPEIGYAVKDSAVTEGNLFTNPSRRRRTTIGYLAVAVLGTSEERAAFRRATTRSHARVPGAFDVDLQRWVGACLYRGFEDSCERLHGPLRGAEREAFYRQGVVLGGLLQMPREAWPADREAFEEYWRDGLAQARIDDTLRAYLMSIVRLEYLGRSVPRPAVRLREWLVAGHLPPELRQQMRLPWSARDQRRFDRLLGAVALAWRRLPPERQAWPLTRSIAHVRARRASGRDLFED